MPRQMYSKFMFLFFIRYVRNRIDHWCTVDTGNPNPRVHRSSGKLGEASFPTGTVDPRVGISLSPLNTNDGFSLSIFIYFVTLKTEYYAKGCVRENKSKKFKVRIKRMTVKNEDR